MKTQIEFENQARLPMLYNQMTFRDKANREQTLKDTENHNSIFWTLPSIRYYMNEESHKKIGEYSEKLFEKETTFYEVLCFLISRWSLSYASIDNQDKRNAIDQIISQVGNEMASFESEDWMFHPFIRMLRLEKLDGMFNEIEDIYFDQEGNEIFKFVMVSKNQNMADWMIDFYGNDEDLIRYIKMDQTIENRTFDSEPAIAGYPVAQIKEVKLLYRENAKFNDLFEANLSSYLQGLPCDQTLLRMDTLTLLDHGFNPNHVMRLNYFPFIRYYQHPDDQELFKFFGLVFSSINKATHQYELANSEVYRAILYLQKCIYYKRNKTKSIQLRDFYDPNLISAQVLQSDFFKFGLFNSLNTKTVNIEAIHSRLQSLLEGYMDHKYYERHIIGTTFIDNALLFYRKTELNNSDQFLIQHGSNPNKVQDINHLVQKNRLYSQNKDWLNNAVVFICTNKNPQKIVDRCVNYGVHTVVNFTGKKLNVPVNIMIIDVQIRHLI